MRTFCVHVYFNIGLIELQAALNWKGTEMHSEQAQIDQATLSGRVLASQGLMCHRLSGHVFHLKEKRCALLVTRCFRK